MQFTCKVELVQEHPVTGLEGGQQRPVTPGKLTRQAPLHRQVRTEQVHDVCLLAKIDTHMPPPCAYRVHKSEPDMLSASLYFFATTIAGPGPFKWMQQCP